jgi:hypothetical protein
MENMTKDVTIDGMKFQLNKMPALTALKLDKKVVTLMLPIFVGLEDLHLDGEAFKLDSMAKAIQETLINLDDKEWDGFIQDMLSHVIYLPDDDESQQLTSKVINNIFRAKLFIVYELLFEVMQFNKFTPFEMVEGGKLTKGIGGFSKQKEKKEKNGKKSEKLDLLKEN